MSPVGKLLPQTSFQLLDDTSSSSSIFLHLTTPDGSKSIIVLGGGGDSGALLLPFLRQREARRGEDRCVKARDLGNIHLIVVKAKVTLFQSFLVDCQNPHLPQASTCLPPGHSECTAKGGNKPLFQFSATGEILYFLPSPLSRCLFMYRLCFFGTPPVGHFSSCSATVFSATLTSLIATK